MADTTTLDEKNKIDLRTEVIRSIEMQYSRDIIVHFPSNKPVRETITALGQYSWSVKVIPIDIARDNGISNNNYALCVDDFCIGFVDYNGTFHANTNEIRKIDPNDEYGLLMFNNHKIDLADLETLQMLEQAENHDIVGQDNPEKLKPKDVAPKDKIAEQKDNSVTKATLSQRPVLTMDTAVALTRSQV